MLTVQVKKSQNSKIVDEYLNNQGIIDMSNLSVNAFQNRSASMDLCV